MHQGRSSVQYRRRTDKWESVCAVSIRGIDVMCTVECGAVNIKIAMRARSDIGVGTELSFDLNEEYIWPVSDGEV